jgi:ABC-type multidrug transport system fused ATPase/permease subunit
VLIGANLVAGKLTGYSSSPETIIAFTQYFTMISMSMMAITRIFVMITKSSASAKRIQEVVDTKDDIVLHTEDEFPALKTDKHIIFDNVSFSYNGLKDNLTNISFSVERGGTLGIIGSTGSGKTSLVNLIPRFYEATTGRVLVNGRDVKSLDVDALRDSVAIVPQKAVLFSGTVRSNLRWGNPDATDEEMWQALERAQAKEFVAQKNGLDEPVSAGGKNFSGGQRQRLTIARALIRGAEILILDDSSSALDYATDAALRAALHTLPNSPTTFIISQRTSSIRYADLILVMEDGRLVDRGRHDELLARCEVYREIHESQFKKGGEAQ